jgi:predicted DNA-binding transcriptional regulator AlpA
LVNKFKDTGSVHERDRSGRPRSIVTAEAVENVREKLHETSNFSIRDCAIELGMSTSSFYRAVKEAGFRPFKLLSTVIELSEDDFDKRVEFCDTMLSIFDKNLSMVNKIIWSDESLFTLNGVIIRHNCCYWAYSNPNVQIPVSHSKDGVMVWCGITSDGLIGPYFFNGTVTGESYLNMLRDFLWPKVRHIDKMGRLHTIHLWQEAGLMKSSMVAGLEEEIQSNSRLVLSTLLLQISSFGAI